MLLMTKPNSVFQSRYFYLLVALISYFVLSPFFLTEIKDYFFMNILFTLVILFSANIVRRGKIIMTLTLIFGVLSFGSTWYMTLITPDIMTRLCHFMITLIFLSIITCSVLYSITRHQEISGETLLGAICGYLLIGATWSFIYLIISTLDPNAITDNFAALNVTRRAQDAEYFSFITLTTTGYGDILPKSASARVWAWLEAATGQIYLAVWISRLVGLQVAQKFAQLRN
jgi:voltage-gated potassium channel